MASAGSLNLLSHRLTEPPLLQTYGAVPQVTLTKPADLLSGSTGIWRPWGMPSTPGMSIQPSMWSKARFLRRQAQGGVGWGAEGCE